MKQSFASNLSRLLCVAILLGATLSVGGLAQAQTPTKKAAANPPSPKAALKVAGDGPLLARNGLFDSTRAHIVLRPKQMPGDTNPAKKFDFNLWVTIAQAWNQSKVQQQSIVKKYIESTVGLESVNVHLGDAKLNPKAGDYPTFNKEDGTIFTPLLMYVDPKQQSLVVVFTVTGNSMSASVPVSWGFDDVLNAKFDMKLMMFFDTKGPASNPLVLKSSKVTVRNFDSSSVGGSEANTAATKFKKATYTDGGSGNAMRTSINSLLRQHTVSSKLGIVTPGVYAGSDRLVFELSPVPLGLSPNAKNVKK
jgi:hypothetical protein